MNSLMKEIDNRLAVLNGDLPEEEEVNSKVFTVRLPITLIEGLEDIGGALQMKRTEVARMILTHGVAEIFEKYNIKVEKFGCMSFEDQYAIEIGEKRLDLVDGKLILSDVEEGTGDE